MNNAFMKINHFISSRRALKIKGFLCLMKVQNSTLTLQILLRLFFKGAPNMFLQPGLFFKKYIYIFFLLIYLAHMILVSWSIEKVNTRSLSLLLLLCTILITRPYLDWKWLYVAYAKKIIMKLTSSFIC